jgi:hypothetical protein
MGLLDEAIREHLELKRRRGADPAEVAREQREALDPISAPAPTADPLDGAADGALEGDPPTEEHAVGAEAGDAHPADAIDAEGYAPDAASTVGPGDSAAPSSLEPDETAELDMSTVLHEEPPGVSARSGAAVGEDARGARPPDAQAQPEHEPGERADSPDGY